MAVRHLSTLSPRKLHITLNNLPDSKLEEIVRDGQNNQGAPSYMAALALGVLERRNAHRRDADARSHGPNSETVADEVIAETDVSAGVSALPVELDVPPEVASKIPRGINAPRAAPTDTNRSMRKGVVGLPSPNMTYAAQGGIVNFAEGGSTKEPVPPPSFLNKVLEAKKQRMKEEQKAARAARREEDRLGSAIRRAEQLRDQKQHLEAIKNRFPNSELYKALTKKKAQGGIVNLRSGGSLRDWLDKSRTKEHEEWLNYILQAESSTSLEKIRAMLDEQDALEGAAGAPPQMSRLGELATLEGDGGQSIGPMQLKGPPGSILSADKKGVIKVPEDKTDINASVRAAERHFENLLRLNDGEAAKTDEQKRETVRDALRNYNQGRGASLQGKESEQATDYLKGYDNYLKTLAKAEEAGGPVSDAPRAVQETIRENKRRLRRFDEERNKALLEKWGRVPPTSGRFASKIAEVAARTKAEAEAKDQLAGEKFSTQPVFAEPEPTAPGKPPTTSGIASVAASAQKEARARARDEVEAEDPLAGEDPNEPVFNQERFEQMTKGAELLKSLPPPARESLQTKGISPIRLALILGGLKLMSGESLGDAAEKAVAAYIKSSEYEALRLKAYDKALREEAKAKATADYQNQRIALMKEGAANKRLKMFLEPEVQASIRTMVHQDVVASDKSGSLGSDFPSYGELLAEVNKDPEGELAVIFNSAWDRRRHQFLNRQGHWGSGSDPIKSIQQLPQRMP
jgi:hypothetical protein